MKSSSTVHSCRFVFFNDTATTEIYTLSLHDALPICVALTGGATYSLHVRTTSGEEVSGTTTIPLAGLNSRSEEHTSELQSRFDLVCRLLLEKKKKNKSVICRCFIIKRLPNYIYVSLI